MQTFLPFLLFAFVASITPGPTNILILTQSLNHGFRSALPAVLGACAAAALIVLLVGQGFGDLLQRQPALQRSMAWLGVAWLSYLAWRIFSSPVEPLNLPDRPPVKPFGLVNAAVLQLVNPKTWMMALAVLGVFAGQGEQQDARLLQLALLFFLVSLPCLAVWALLGVSASRFLHSPGRLRYFNRAMAGLLIASAWLSVLL